MQRLMTVAARGSTDAERHSAVIYEIKSFHVEWPLRDGNRGIVPTRRDRGSAAHSAYGSVRVF